MKKKKKKKKKNTHTHTRAYRRGWRHGSDPALGGSLRRGQQLVVQGVGINALLRGLEQGVAFGRGDAEAQRGVVDPIGHRLRHRGKKG